MIKALLAGAALLGFTSAAQGALIDGSFETQGSSVSNYCYFGFSAGGNDPCDAGAWTGTGNAGLQDDHNGSWPGIDSPDGSKYGFIQLTGTLQQAFSVATSGYYALSWIDAGRPANGGSQGNQNYDVFIGVNNVAGGLPTHSGQGWTQRHGAYSFRLDAGQTYLVRFVGMTTTGDNTAYIDGVTLTSAPAPEPAIWALTIGGFGLAGAAMRRRKVAVSYG